MNTDNPTELVTEIESSPRTPLEKLDRSLSDVFGTARMEQPTNAVSIIDEHGEIAPGSDLPDDGKVETDAEFARSNMYTLLRQGQEALEYALQVAKDSENPRAFEVVFAGLKNLSDMNNQLIDIHSKKRDAKGIKGAAPPQKVVNNAVFVGTTKDLNKMILDMNKDE